MKLNKFFTAAALASLLLTAGACKDQIEYTPTPAFAGDEVYFSDELDPDVALVDNQSEFPVTINRVKAADEITVPVTGKAYDADGNDCSSIFTFPASVTFAVDAKEVEYNVGVTFASIVPNTDYTITLTLGEDYTTPYGASETTVTVCYAPWTEWTAYSGEAYEGEMGSPFTGEPIGGIVSWRQSLIDTNIKEFNFPGPRYTNLAFDYTLTMDENETIEVDGETCYIVKMPITDIRYNMSDDDSNPNDLLYADAYTFFADYYIPEKMGAEPTKENVERMMFGNGYDYSYYIPSKGRFMMTLVPFTANPLGIYNESVTVLQLPGYADYYVQFSKLGNFVNAAGEEGVVIHSTMSADLASYSYNILPGALDDDEIAAAIEALKNDDEAEKYTEKSRDFFYPFEEEGKYTLVAVGYDAADNDVYDTSFGFTAATVQANNPWKLIGTAEYTDTFIFDVYCDIEDPAEECIGGETWEVDVEENEETPGVYRLVNPYYGWGEIAGYPYAEYPEGNYYITLDCSDPDHVVMPIDVLGVIVNPQEGQVIGGSLAYNYEAQGATVEEIEEMGLYGTYSDGLITFPINSLFCSIESVFPKGWLANLNDFFLVDMSGAEPLAARGRKVAPRKAPAAKAQAKPVSEAKVRASKHDTITKERAHRIQFQQKTLNN